MVKPQALSEVSAVDVASLDSQPNTFTISGQVELTWCNESATGEGTKLDIQWQSAGITRQGQVDYSSGQFMIAVPTLNSGKVLGRLTDEKGMVLGTGEYELDQSSPTTQSALRDVALLVEPQAAEILGQVVSAYDVGKAFVSLFGTEVFGPSSTQTVGDKFREF